MNLWTYVWFQNLITWCRKWKWFDTYVYGESTCLEDFVRNPAEVMRNTYFPLAIKNTIPISVINLRCGYKQFVEGNENPSCWSIPLGKRKLLWRKGEWTYFDLRIWNPWVTKYLNAAFFFQLALNFKYYVFPFPFVALCIRVSEYHYFQFGLGWGANSPKGDLKICGKFAFVNQDEGREVFWNPTDITGFDEGNI
jgi:hypothetical protein